MCWAMKRTSSMECSISTGRIVPPPPPATRFLILCCWHVPPFISSGPGSGGNCCCCCCWPKRPFRDGAEGGTCCCLAGLASSISAAAVEEEELCCCWCWGCTIDISVPVRVQGRALSSHSESCWGRGGRVMHKSFGKNPIKTRLTQGAIRWVEGERKLTLRTIIVTNTESVTRIIVKRRYFPRSGTVNEVGGMISARSKKNTYNQRRRRDR